MTITFVSLAHETSKPAEPDARAKAAQQGNVERARALLGSVCRPSDRVYELPFTFDAA